MTQQEQEQGQQKIIYEQEAEKLEESTGEIDYFKPVKGKNKLRIDEEPVIKKKQKDWDDEPQEYVEIPVTVKDDETGEPVEKIWEMKRSRTLSSKWGQLVQYGKHMDGLKDEMINWFVQGEGKDTTHTLLDLADIDERGVDTEQVDESERVEENDENSEVESDEKESVF